MEDILSLDSTSKEALLDHKHWERLEWVTRQ